MKIGWSRTILGAVVVTMACLKNIVARHPYTASGEDSVRCSWWITWRSRRRIRAVFIDEAASLCASTLCGSGGLRAPPDATEFTPCRTAPRDGVA